jgi:CRP/FNR family transcriptional regulator
MTIESDPLSSIPLVRHLSADERDEVLGAGTERSLGKNEVLFHEGDDAESVFAVIKGRVKLIRYSPQGKEMLLHLVGPGQSFAEAALFGRGTYPATAIAVEPSRLWCLPRHRLEEIIRRSPELGMSMVASISVWTRTLASKLELLTQRRVEERVAIYLISRSRGKAIRPGESFQLSEPKNLIAAQCGTAPEVLSRTFRRLEDDGILTVDADEVRILNPDKLLALAEWIEE